MLFVRPRSGGGSTVVFAVIFGLMDGARVFCLYLRGNQTVVFALIFGLMDGALVFRLYLRGI